MMLSGSTASSTWDICSRSHATTIEKSADASHQLGQPSAQPAFCSPTSARRCPSSAGTTSYASRRLSSMAASPGHSRRQPRRASPSVNTRSSGSFSAVDGGTSAQATGCDNGQS
uniref:Uncharacterized protein n=1 Tax=Plectus sambesii TaxID=2011161 RepID=A0A914UTY2_9BILA